MALDVPSSPISTPEKSSIKRVLAFQIRVLESIWSRVFYIYLEQIYSTREQSLPTLHLLVKRSTS